MCQMQQDEQGSKNGGRHHCISPLIVMDNGKHRTVTMAFTFWTTHFTESKYVLKMMTVIYEKEAIPMSFQIPKFPVLVTPAKLFSGSGFFGSKMIRLFGSRSGNSNVH